MGPSRGVDYLIIALNAFFVFSCVAIETHYCSSPLTPASAHEPYMVRVTREYAETSNPLFLSRPEWLRVATCVSAYGLVWGYVAVLAMFILRLDALRTPVLMFVGCKSYAIFQYWLMEFTAGPLSPPDLPSFLGPELPYVISLALVSARLLPSATPFAGGGAARNAKRD